MNPIHVPVSKPEDWQALLAEPKKHWKAGYSAMALARCWMGAEGFPQSVREALSASGIGGVADAEMLVAIPEHEMPLRVGGARPSQNDLFVLANGGGEMTSTFGRRRNER